MVTHSDRFRAAVAATSVTDLLLSYTLTEGPNIERRFFWRQTHRGQSGCPDGSVSDALRAILAYAAAAGDWPQGHGSTLRTSDRVFQKCWEKKVGASLFSHIQVPATDLTVRRAFLIGRRT